MIVSKLAGAEYGFQITRFTAHNPTRLSKRFLLKDDELIKEPGGVLIEGEAERLCLTGIAEFAQLLTDLTPNRALSYGINGHDFARVVTKGKVEAATKDSPLPVIARDREHMRWPEGAGILLGDYDPADDGDSLSPDALLSLLYSACPAIATAPHLHRPSSGSCIINMDTAEKLRGIHGQRVYIVVKDASDLARAGQNLYDRLWLAGKGRIQISASGGMLLRTPIDASVFQPERLDFAGGAECVPPLRQCLPAPTIFNPDAAPMDTAVNLPDLTKAETTRLLKLQTQERKACAAQAAAVRKTWLEGRLIELVNRHPDTSKARLRDVLKQAVEGSVLGPEFVLYTSDMQPITVAELLTDPEHWHGKYLRDPLEVDYGSSTAWVNLEDMDAPFIYSHAHGLNTRYELSALVRTTIELKAGDSPKTVDACIAAMRANGQLYEHGGELVRLVDGGVEPVSDLWLRDHLGRVIYFTRFNVRQNTVVATDCPQDLPRLVLAQRGGWGLRKLRAVISAPILRPDGSILQTKGFDPVTGLYLDLQPDVLIGTKPTQLEVVAALQRLWHPYKEFPFAGPVDRGVHLAAVLTAVLRPILPTAPAFAYDAPTAGSGKTELAKCLAQMAGVDNPAMMPPVTMEDEMRKRLMSVLRAGKPVIILDNQVGQLDSASLCAFLTSEWYSDRDLGHSIMLGYPNTALLIVTGNNFMPIGDLARRVLTSRIDAGMERPDKRSFDLDPKDWVKVNRQSLVRDAITVLLGYRTLDDSRRGEGRMASFEAWDDVVRQTVLWAGTLGVIELGDPYGAVDTAFAHDPDHAKLAALLESWHALYGDKPMKVATVIAETNNAEWNQGQPDEGRTIKLRLRETLMEIAGEGRVVNPRRLGRWIEKHTGGIVEGLRFERGPARDHSATWMVVKKMPEKGV